MLALDYGLLDQKYFQSLTPTEKIFIDHHILNRLIEAENEAQKKSLEKAKDRRQHPGMERYESEDDFWDEIEDAKEEVLRGYE
jgi:hypothetical protein